MGVSETVQAKLNELAEELSVSLSDDALNKLTRTIVSDLKEAQMRPFSCPACGENYFSIFERVLVERETLPVEVEHSVNGGWRLTYSPSDEEESESALDNPHRLNELRCRSRDCTWSTPLKGNIEYEVGF